MPDPEYYDDLGGIVLNKEEAEKLIRQSADIIRKKGKLPVFFNPKVSMKKGGKTVVSFYCFTEGLGARKGLFLLEYTHLPYGAVDRTAERCIVDMGMGPIP